MILLRRLVLCGFLLLAIPQVALGHATPVEYKPAALSQLKEPPTEIRIQFSEAVESKAAVLRVIAPDGAEVKISKATVTRNGEVVTVPLTVTQSGTYSVLWSVISADDGHFTKGAYAFSIGTPTAASTAAAFDVDHTASQGEIIFIALEMLGQALMLGAFALSLTKFGRDKTICRRWGAIFFSGAALAIVGALAYIVIQSAALERENLYQALVIFLQTVAGRYALLRAGLAVVMAGLLVVPLPNKIRLAAVAACALLFALLRARVSHAAASPEFRVLSIIIMALHILGKNLWVGSIVAFAVALPVLLRNGLAFFARASAELSILLAGAFALGGPTGAYIVWLHLKRFDNIGGTHWGMQFMALVGFAFFLLVVRYYNHVVAARAAERVLAGRADTNAKETVRYSWVALMTEAFVALGVLYFSSVLVITTPPLRSTFFSQTVVSQGVSITLSEHPYEDDMLLVSFWDPDHPQGFTTKELTIYATQEAPGATRMVITPEVRFVGGYAMPVSLLTPPGTWHIEIEAARVGGYDAVAGFHIAVPGDINGTSSHTRQWDAFMMLAIVIGLLCVVGAGALYQNATRLHRRLPMHGPAMDRPRVSVVALAVLLTGTFTVLVALLLYNHSHGGYATLCKRNGHTWTESVPLRAGFPTSSASVIGCTVDSAAGRFHFGDVREYLYYLQNGLEKPKIEQ